MTNRIAHLTTAFEWQCNECGAQNFCSSVKFECDPRDLVPPIGHPDHDRVAELLEASEDHPGEWCSCPNSVVCSACKERFKTTDGSFDPEGSDE